MFARASIFNALVGIAVDVVRLSMALLSFRGFDTPSLPAQGEQRRSSFFNIRRDIGPFSAVSLKEATMAPLPIQTVGVISSITCAQSFKNAFENSLNAIGGQKPVTYFDQAGYDSAL